MVFVGIVEWRLRRRKQRWWGGEQRKTEIKTCASFWGSDSETPCFWTNLGPTQMRGAWLNDSEHSKWSSVSANTKDDAYLQSSFPWLCSTNSVTAKSLLAQLPPGTEKQIDRTNFDFGRVRRFNSAALSWSVNNKTWSLFSPNVVILWSDKFTDSAACFLNTFSGFKITWILKSQYCEEDSPPSTVSRLHCVYLCSWLNYPPRTWTSFKSVCVESQSLSLSLYSTSLCFTTLLWLLILWNTINSRITLRRLQSLFCDEESRDTDQTVTSNHSGSPPYQCEWYEWLHVNWNCVFCWPFKCIQWASQRLRHMSMSEVSENFQAM